MGTVLVDGQEIELQPGEKLNGIQAARRAGVDIPHYCWHAGLSVVASCRMCLVEAGRINPQTGKIEMQPKLVPACQTPAPEGTVFVTSSEKVKNAREMVEEDLLIRHPVDCPICDKAGECSLQDYHFKHGRDERRADIKPFNSRRRDLGDTVTLFVDRCVMCTRCVRFTREISGTSELMVTNRGAHEEIDIFPGYPLDNRMSGNVVDLCPVGALGDRDFLYSQRVWFMKSHDHVCGGCSTGCSIRIDENQDHIYRVKPRENPHINQWWMCDDGRYGWKNVHSERRLTQPVVKKKDARENIEWHELPAYLERELKAAGRLAGVISPHVTVEEAYLVAKYLRSLDPQAILALGPIPVEGEDEKFKNGFTIRAEKCPNRRGVEKVLAGFAQGAGVPRWDDLPGQLAANNIRGLWIAGGYVTDWCTADAAEKLAGLQSLVVHDCFPSPVTEIATIVLPGVTFAERDGSYVNFNDRLQSFRRGVKPPVGVKSEGQLLWQLLGETGLYNSRRVLEEVAREIAFFAPASGGGGELGVDLRVNMLAETAAS